MIKSHNVSIATGYFLRAMMLSVLLASPILPFAVTKAFDLVSMDSNGKSAGAGLVLFVSLQR